MKLHPFDGERPAWRVIGVLLLRVWLGAMLVLWVLQDAVVFPGWWMRREEVAALHALAREQGFEVVRTPAEDGADAVLWVHDTGADRAVLFWHGNGELVADHAPFANRLGEMGWDFIGVELRGYGDASGWPRETTLDRDARAAWAWALTEGGFSADRIVIHGRSVGGGPAAKLASTVHPAGLVLEATFDSLTAVAHEKAPFVPAIGWLMRTRYATADLPLDLPVFQVHSDADEVIGIEHARALRRVLPDVTVVESKGYHHGDPVLLVDASAGRAWARWLEERVPAG